MNSIYSQNRQSLENYFEVNNISKLHIKPTMKSIFSEVSFGKFDKTNLPLKFREIIRTDFSYHLPTATSEKISSYDASVKFALKLQDGSEVETVIMPEKNRITLCISTQVGCAQGCIFCHTGKMGLIRNLRSEEIIAQVLFANNWISKHSNWLKNLNFSPSQRITNIVFMGMGEPCDNPKGVIEAVKLMIDPWGLEIAPKKITVSTAGHLDGFKEIYSELPTINYALSLHSTSNAERSKLMPINRRFPISEVLDCLSTISHRDNKSFLIQYTVIDKVNDDIDSAKKLAKLLEKMNCKVNLIPLNPIDPSRLNSPEPKRLISFRDMLHSLDVRVMIRYSKGQDIDAACGQLVSQNSLNEHSIAPKVLP